MNTAWKARTNNHMTRQRAGRTIGRLSLTARKPLQQAQVAALSAAADLIAVATYNVELYEREQASVRRLRETRDQAAVDAALAAWHADGAPR